MLTFFKAMSVIIFCMIFVVLFIEEIITEKPTIGLQMILLFQVFFVVTSVFVIIHFELYAIMALFDCSVLIFFIIELYDEKYKY